MLKETEFIFVFFSNVFTEFHIFCLGGLREGENTPSFSHHPLTLFIRILYSIFISSFALLCCSLALLQFLSSSFLYSTCPFPRLFSSPALLPLSFYPSYSPLSATPLLSFISLISLLSLFRTSLSCLVKMLIAVSSKVGIQNSSFIHP